jgi:hypothetical protein
MEPKSYVLPSATDVFHALHAEAMLRTTPENVEDVMDALRRILEQAGTSREAAPLPAWAMSALREIAASAKNAGNAYIKLIADDMMTHQASPNVTGPVERRRDLANAKLPLDVECALEHVAIVMNQAHQRLTDVLRKHLPSENGDGR